VLCFLVSFEPILKKCYHLAMSTSKTQKATTLTKVFDLGFELHIDENGYVQASQLVKKMGSAKFKASNFRFDLNKVEGLTPFQKRIYKELIKVPAGKTVSYLELGKRAGYKNASRAVGTAMSKNKLVLFIPCHRVVRSDGSLGNFSGCGGTATKKRLLEVEATQGNLY